MKSVKKAVALFVLNLMSLPYLLMAQDDATYIDNMNVQDSSYMEQDIMTDAGQSSGTNTTVIIIIAVVVIAVIAFILLRKKKK